jgi:hypothetical protein
MTPTGTISSFRSILPPNVALLQSAKKQGGADQLPRVRPKRATLGCVVALLQSARRWPDLVNSLPFSSVYAPNYLN